MKQDRARKDRTNKALERWVTELAELLAPAEAAALALAPRSIQPLVLVVGAPRCGATLVLQSIAASGVAAYPTNLLARFAHAPSIGARIQRMLLDPALAEGQELGDLKPAAVGFDSDLGRSTGALGPSEFSEFWRRFLPVHELEPIGDRTADVDVQGLRRALAALTNVFACPFAMKGTAVMSDIPFFAEALPEALFVHVERDGVANARSLLDARKQSFGSLERWYSARPAEYWDLVALPPAAQVAGQVFHTNRRIRAALAALPEARSLHVSYEEFCAAPAVVHAQLVDRLACHGAALGAACEDVRSREYAGPDSFVPRLREKARGAEAEAVVAAWSRLVDACAT